MTEGKTPLPRVSLVGLGNMGQAIGERLAEAGYPLLVANRSAGRDGELIARGASPLGSVARALVDADVCVTSLADDDALDAVVCGEHGILAHARRAGILIETSTVSVAASERAARAAEAAGVAYLRAPFSGNPGAIRAGTAAIFVSGGRATADACDDLLRAIAPTVRYVGEGEAARTLKLVLQVLIGGTAELLAEALVLGEAGGIDRGTLLDVIGASVVGSRFVAYKSEPLMRDDFSATFTTAMMAKDVDLVLDVAEEAGVELPLTGRLRSLLATACDGGHADKDFMALILQLRDGLDARRALTRDG